MTIHALEHDDPLTVERIRRYPTAHPRCGTEFLVVFIIVSILLFSVLAGTELWVGIVGRILLIPVVASIAYEILRWGAKRRDSWAVRWLFLPGIWLQAITTKQPDDSMIEVAIASMREALAANGEEAAGGQPGARDRADPRREDAGGRRGGSHRERRARHADLVSLDDRLDEVETALRRDRGRMGPTGGLVRPGPDAGPGPRARSPGTGRRGLPTAAKRRATSSLARPRRTRIGLRPRVARDGERDHRRVRAGGGAPRRGAARPAAAARPQRRPQRDHGDQRRRGRRGGGPVREGPAAHVPALRRAAPLEDRADERQRDRHRRDQQGHRGDRCATAPTAA